MKQLLMHQKGSLLMANSFTQPINLMFSQAQDTGPYSFTQSLTVWYTYSSYEKWVRPYPLTKDPSQLINKEHLFQNRVLNQPVRPDSLRRDSLNEKGISSGVLMEQSDQKPKSPNWYKQFVSTPLLNILHKLCFEDLAHNRKETATVHSSRACIASVNNHHLDQFLKCCPAD